MKYNTWSILRLKPRGTLFIIICNDLIMANNDYHWSDEIGADVIPSMFLSFERNKNEERLGDYRYNLLLKDNIWSQCIDDIGG